jgi:hypothetical protein
MYILRRLYELPQTMATIAMVVTAGTHRSGDMSALQKRTLRQRESEGAMMIDLVDFGQNAGAPPAEISVSGAISAE